MEYEYKAAQALRADVFGKWYVCKGPTFRGNSGWYVYLNRDAAESEDPEFFNTKEEAEETIALHVLTRSA